MLVDVQMGVLVATHKGLRDLLHCLLDLQRQLLVRVAEAVEDLEEVSYGGDAEVCSIKERMVRQDLPEISLHQFVAVEDDRAVCHHDRRLDVMRRDDDGLVEFIYRLD